jgi:hypothetical protein
MLANATSWIVWKLGVGTEVRCAKSDGLSDETCGTARYSKGLDGITVKGLTG